MGQPIENQALERVQNDPEVNIAKGKVAAWKALCKYIQEGTDNAENLYVPDISHDDDRLRDVSLMSYNAIRAAWIGMFVHWKYPDLFVVVECVNGSVYTQVNKHVDRHSDHSQTTLW